MERDAALPEQDPPTDITLRPYRPRHDHRAIRFAYGAAFGDDPWPADWTEFSEFRPDGVFVAHAAAELVGFAISFPRGDHGYISVVAVCPGHRRRGIATSLVGAAAAFLRTKDLHTLRIDAFGDSPPAVATYWSMGFRIYEIKLESQGEP